MNIVINGCSFMDNHHYAEYFGLALNGRAINLARPGSSNRRIIRTTVEYIKQHRVDFVMLGLTFYDRQESPFVVKDDPWVSYNSQGIQAVFSDINDYHSPAEYQLIDQYIKDRYRYDINEQYLNSLYLDLELFAGFLKSRNIGYCIFNMCDRHYQNPTTDPGFIPNFIGNTYLEENGVQCMEQDRELPQNARHHYGEDAILLVEYVTDYCRKHNLV